MLKENYLFYEFVLLCSKIKVYVLIHAKTPSDSNYSIRIWNAVVTADGCIPGYDEMVEAVKNSYKNGR